MAVVRTILNTQSKGQLQVTESSTKVKRLYLLFNYSHLPTFNSLISCVLYLRPSYSHITNITHIPKILSLRILANTISPKITSNSNPINLSTDSSSSDRFWEEFLKTGRVEEEVSSWKRAHSKSSKGGWNNYFPPRKTFLSCVKTNPSAAGPSAIQPRPQVAIIKESISDLSSMPSYVSPYEGTDDETSSRVHVVPPLAAVIPPEELQAPPLQALLTAPPPKGPSSSSPLVRGRVIGLACPRVWQVIGGPRVQKEMPNWGIAKKP